MENNFDLENLDNYVPDEKWHEVTNEKFADLRTLRLYQKNKVLMTVVGAGIDHNTKKDTFHVVFERVSIHSNGTYLLLEKETVDGILSNEFKISLSDDGKKIRIEKGKRWEDLNLTERIF